MIRTFAASLAAATVLATTASGQQLTEAQSTSLRDELEAGDIAAAMRLRKPNLAAA